MDSALNSMTEAVTKLTENLQTLTLAQEKQAREQKKAEVRMQSQIEAMSARLESHEQQLATSTVLPQGVASDSVNWKVDSTELPQGWAERPLTGAETAQLIQQVLDKQVKPAVQQAYSHLDSRLTVTEEEISQIRMRVSWVEKDMLYQQIQQAKHTVLCRTWPDKFTLADRKLTVEKALRAAGLDSRLCDIHTGQYENDNNEVELSRITILTFCHFTDRQQFLHYHKGKDFTAIPGKFWKTEKGQGLAGDEEDKWTVEDAPDERIKITPGITQIERRLEAPLFGLMNSLSTVLLKYKGKSFKPHWKSLVVVGPEGEWLGQVRYERIRPSQSGQTPAHTDFACKVYIPEELKDQVLQSWADTWYDQLKKQYQQTEDEEKAISASSQQTAEDYSKVVRFTKMVNRTRPDWQAGQEQNVHNWVARFKWEFPWQLTFHGVSAEDPMRKSFTELQNVEDLMKEMDEAAQGGANMQVDLSPGQTLEDLVTPKMPPPQPSQSSNSQPPNPQPAQPATGKGGKGDGGTAKKRASPTRETPYDKHQKHN